MSRTAQDIVEIGKEPIAVKERVGHGNFGPWLTQFNMSRTTAGRFMRIATTFGDRIVQIEHFVPEALYELSSPSTSEDVRAELIERVAAGETVTVAHVRDPALGPTTSETSMRLQLRYRFPGMSNRANSGAAMMPASRR
jgi:hypothetical protein